METITLEQAEDAFKTALQEADDTRTRPGESAALIRAARYYVPMLLEEIKELRALLQECVEVFEVVEAAPVLATSRGDVKVNVRAILKRLKVQEE